MKSIEDIKKARILKIIKRTLNILIIIGLGITAKIWIENYEFLMTDYGYGGAEFIAVEKFEQAKLVIITAITTSITVYLIWARVVLNA